MKLDFVLITLLCAMSFLPLSSMAQQNDEGYIYGEVETRSGNTYIGAIRWGKEEVFWNDIFNAVKTEQKIDEEFDELRKKELRELSILEDFDWNILTIWDDKYSVVSAHQFAIRFGDIKEVVPESSDTRFNLILKNDQSVVLSDNSNDIGATLQVYDQDLGKISIRWNNILRVRFEDTPEKLEYKFGPVLYGTVNTIHQNFTGYVQWDHDERLGTDRLDGEYKGSSWKLPFEKIREIERSRGSCVVQLYDGQKLILSGTNDVDDGNRGIIVTVDSIGKLDIPWSEFVSVKFDITHQKSGMAYSAYVKPQMLSGTVTNLKGDRYTGKIVFDRDESLDCEILDGENGRISWRIPFRNINRIRPKSDSHAYVQLRNGEELLLGYGQDVSDKNEGVLILERGGKEPVYIHWNDVDEINFE